LDNAPIAINLTLTATLMNLMNYAKPKLLSFRIFLFKVRLFWNANPLVSSLAVFIVIFTAYYLSYMLVSGVSSLDDHLFLYRFAEIIKEQGFQAVNNFHWIRFSEFAGGKTPYSASLFNYLLIPFTFFKDKTFGLKISDIFWASLSLSIIYYVLRKMKINFAFLYILLLISINTFSMRIIMGRAVLVISGLIVAEFYLAVNKKYKKLFFVSLLHILLHQATFFIPLLISLVVEAVRYIHKEQPCWKNIWSSALAFIMGMAFYPNFPKNIYRLAKTLLNLQSSVLSSQDMRLVEGAELFPKKINFILDSSPILLLAFFIGIAIAVYFYIRLKKGEPEITLRSSGNQNSVMLLSAFLLGLIFFAGSLMISGRFYDFYFPFAILLVAIVLKTLFENRQVIISAGTRNSMIIAICLFLIIPTSDALINSRQNTSRNDLAPWKEASEWIRDRSSDRDNVFLHNWSFFPVAFFYNQKNDYTTGAEPKLLLDYNPRLFWEWFNIFRNNYYCTLEKNCYEEEQAIIKSIGDDKDKQAEFEKKNSALMIKAIKQDFQSRYIFSNSPTFNGLLEKNQDLIADSFESKSEISGTVVKVFELK
jgi:hypothetical protein